MKTRRLKNNNNKNLEDTASVDGVLSETIRSNNYEKTRHHSGIVWNGGSQPIMAKVIEQTGNLSENGEFH